MSFFRSPRRTNRSSQEAPRFPINPRYRAYGKARIDIARRVQSQEDWETLWKPPAHPFPFAWKGPWKQCTEYKVDDYAAEVGFFTDILGLPVNAFGPDYAQFTSPYGDFYFAFTPTQEGESSTPPDAIRLQFMIQDILSTTWDLKGRGIVFELEPQPVTAGSNVFFGFFRTPHGIPVDLYGETSVTAPVSSGQERANRFSAEPFDQELEAEQGRFRDIDVDLMEEETEDLGENLAFSEKEASPDVHINEEPGEDEHALPPSVFMTSPDEPSPGRDEPNQDQEEEAPFKPERPAQRWRAPNLPARRTDRSSQSTRAPDFRGASSFQASKEPSNIPFDDQGTPSEDDPVPFDDVEEDDEETTVQDEGENTGDELTYEDIEESDDTYE